MNAPALNYPPLDYPQFAKLSRDPCLVSLDGLILLVPSIVIALLQHQMWGEREWTQGMIWVLWIWG